MTQTVNITGCGCDFSFHFLCDHNGKRFIWSMSHSSSDWWCKFELINKLRQILVLFWGGNILRTLPTSVCGVSIILTGSCWCLYAHNAHTHTSTHKLLLVFYSYCLLCFHTHTHTHTPFLVMSCEELKCHRSRGKAWIILLVSVFSIIAKPPGMVYGCPLPPLSNSRSHPSVSYVILPQINTGHDCSTSIGLCGVHSSHRCLGLCHWLCCAVCSSRPWSLRNFKNANNRCWFWLKY